MEGFKYKKSFGQNFINNSKIINNIISCSNIKDNSLVIEIGPGSGNLTRELSKVSNYVLAYEIDERLEEILDENLVDCDNVTVVYEDFLKSDLASDISKYEYMTEEAGIRRGLLGPFWRSHEMRVRGWLEDYFQIVHDSLFEAMVIS